MVRNDSTSGAESLFDSLETIAFSTTKSVTKEAQSNAGSGHCHRDARYAIFSAATVRVTPLISR